MNWDKVALGVGSAIIAGVVGYFSGIVAIKSEVASLKAQLAAVKTELSASVNPKLKDVDSTRDRVKVVEIEIGFLKKQNEIAVQTSQMLDLLIKQERESTLSALTELLERSLAPASVPAGGRRPLAERQVPCHTKDQSQTVSGVDSCYCVEDAQKGREN